MNLISSTRRALALSLVSALTACAVPNQATAPVSGTRVADNNALIVYAGQPRASWHITVADFEGQQTLSGATVTVPKSANPKVPDSQVGARVSGKEGQTDALTLQWKDAWYASLRVDGGTPLDLRPYAADGTLEFDLDVKDMAKGGLTFAMSCGKDCGRKLPYVLPSRALAGKGWQHLSFSMACFVREGDDFSAVTQPFALDSSGSGEASVANIRFVQHGKSNAACPDYRTESVTPGPLTQVWALEWWMPRHEKKLEEIRQLKTSGLNSDLVFIGDSITQGWEDAGRKVWDAHFSQHHALDLGFGGDHTENALWRLQHGEIDGIAPKVAVLMIGTNNTGDRLEDPKTTATGIKRIVEELQRRLPETKIVVLAIFPRDEQPTSLLRQLNNRVNTIIAGLADGQHVFFLNINESLMNPDGSLSKDIMPDLLHLSEKGYGLWASSLAPALSKLLAR